MLIRRFSCAWRRCDSIDECYDVFHDECYDVFHEHEQNIDLNFPLFVLGYDKGTKKELLNRMLNRECTKAAAEEAWSKMLK